MSNKYLKDSIDVPFADIYLDPNNPRIVPEEPVGYDDPKAIIDPEVQIALEKKVQEVYDVDELLVQSSMKVGSPLTRSSCGNCPEPRTSTS